MISPPRCVILLLPRGGLSPPRDGSRIPPAPGNRAKRCAKWGLAPVASPEGEFSSPSDDFPILAEYFLHPSEVIFPSPSFIFLCRGEDLHPQGMVSASLRHPEMGQRHRAKWGLAPVASPEDEFHPRVGIFTMKSHPRNEYSSEKVISKSCERHQHQWSFAFTGPSQNLQNPPKHCANHELSLHGPQRTFQGPKSHSGIRKT